MVVTVAAVAFVKLARSSNPLRGAALAMAGVYVIESFFINSVTSLQITGLTALVLAAALAAGERERDAIAKGT